MFLYILPYIIHHQSSNFQLPIIRQRIPLYEQRLKFLVPSKVHLLLLIHQHSYLGRLSVVYQNNLAVQHTLCKSESMTLSTNQHSPINLNDILSNQSFNLSCVFISVSIIISFPIADTTKPFSSFHHHDIICLYPYGFLLSFSLSVLSLLLMMMIFLRTL